MAYQPERVPLLSRGWVLAYCHTRGGGEMGRKWYYAALRESKHKTVEVMCMVCANRTSYCRGTTVYAILCFDGSLLFRFCFKCV